MSDEMKDYVDNFRASLPAGITYDSDIARYFANNKRFLNEWEVERYLNYITKFGFSAGFDPASLFSNGEQGAWYDPSDLTTLYQDSAGTTPVTADGDPVGRMEDKSGNGNHATQATSAARPVYRTDGTLHWLEFDGVDDSMIITGVDRSSWTDAMAITAGQAQGGKGSYLNGLYSPGEKNHEPYDDNLWYVAFGSDTRIDTGATLNYSTNYVLSRVRTSGVTDFRRNSISVGTDTGNPTSYNAANDIRIGFNTEEYLDGRIHGIIIVNSTSGVSGAESYLATKSGVTL